MNFLAIDIGGTSIKSAIINEQKHKIHLTHQQETKFNNEDPQSSIINTLNKYKHDKFVSVCVSATGVINNKGIVCETNNKINGYLGLNIEALIYDFYQCECTVINDVNAIAYYILANRIKMTNTLVIALGTGIGGAYISENNILTGSNGAFAEIGQIPIEDRTFEELASTKALVQLAQNKYNLNFKNGRELFSCYSENPQIQECVSEWCSFIAKGIRVCLYVYNPQEIIIAGGISAQAPILIPIIQKELIAICPKHYTNNLKLSAVAAKNDAGMIGAFHYQKWRKNVKKK